MIRNVDINDISDGRFYEPDDLVKIGCHDCAGCSSCCHDMEALILDPMDVYRLVKGLGKSFEDFLGQEVELARAGGLILPKISMKAQEGACFFLNEEGRCSIHPFRPGLCRLFPMGRLYEEDGFHYFLQANECGKKNRYKVKLRDWIDTPDLESYHAFLLSWHSFTKKLGEKTPLLTDESRQQVLTYVLRLFYQLSWQPSDFYLQYDARMQQAKRVFSALL